MLVRTPDSLILYVDYDTRFLNSICWLGHQNPKNSIFCLEHQIPQFNMLVRTPDSLILYVG